MAEEVTPPEGGGDVQKFAGKYDSPEALEAGYREIRGKLGMGELPTDKPLFGSGGRYADVAALEASYKDLETALRARGTPTPPKDGDKPPATPPKGDLGITPASEAAPEDDIGIDEILQKSGLKAEDLVTAFTQKGELTTDQYKAIQKARPGLSKKIINTLIRGEMAAFEAIQQRAGAARAKAIESLGGEQQHDALRQWASENVPAAELKRLGQLVEADPDFYPTMMDIVAHRYQAAVKAGNAKPLVTGDAPASGGSMPTTLDEFTKLADKAAAGDRGAIALLKRIPESHIANLN